MSKLSAAGLGVLTSDLFLTVGSGGQFSSIDSALAYCSRLSPTYALSGLTVNIHLLAGFVMDEQVLVSGVNYGWITITGADAETTIDAGCLVNDFCIDEYSENGIPAFGAKSGGVLPVIGQLFRFSLSTIANYRNGIMAIGAGSSVTVLHDCGIIGARYHGLAVSHSATASARSANFSGSGNSGICALRGGVVMAEHSDVSGCGVYGLYAHCAAVISAQGVDASNAGSYGVYCREGSRVSFTEGISSGAGVHGIYCRAGGFVSAVNAFSLLCGSYGAYVLYGSTISAFGLDGTLSKAANVATGAGIIYQ